MTRKLSTRELVLLCILLILVLLSGYVYLFYIPMTQELNALENEIASYEEELLTVQLRVERKEKMQKELDEIFVKEPAPVSIAAFDNLQQVMLELNSILKGTIDYSISFGDVDTSDTIVRRNISLHFTSASYDSALQTLEALHDNSYRCMMDYLNIGISTDENTDIVTGETERIEEVVSVDVTIVFFEYQEDGPQKASAED